MSSSNVDQARKAAEEVVQRDDTKLTEALLADAIGHLADELDLVFARLGALEGRPVPSSFGGINQGHKCGICNQWVPPQTTHTCAGAPPR